MLDSNRAADMIKRLRALFAKKDITADEVDLNEATSEVIALSQAELRRRGVVMSLELADELPRVKGDRIQLQQVVMKLLLNASDALDGVEDRPKRVVIRTREGKGDHVLLSVQDNGVGFDPGFLENLFRPFCTTKVHGMGIGLSVSQSIVESHHGRIWAALKRRARGDIFIFRPSRKPGRIAHRQHRRNEELVMVVRSLVSIVDDDESVRESLPDLLK